MATATRTLPSLDRFLASIQKREFTGRGIGTAYSYASTVVNALGRNAFCKMYEATPAAQLLQSIKATTRTLVYRSRDGVSSTTKKKKGEIKTVGTAGRKSAGEMAENSIMEFENILTTADEDRDGDELSPMGANVDLKMPLLWQHLPNEPIGRLFGVVDQNEQFVKTHAGIANCPMGRDAALLVEYGALRTSHGFKPKVFEPKGELPEDLPADEAEAAMAELGWKVHEYDVMELSLVSIPANTGAVITAFSRNKLSAPLIKGWAQRLYDERPVLIRGNWGAKTMKTGGTLSPHQGVGGNITLNINVGRKSAPVPKVKMTGTKEPKTEKDVTCDKCGNTTQTWSYWLDTSTGKMRCPKCGNVGSINSGFTSDFDRATKPKVKMTGTKEPGKKDFGDSGGSWYCDNCLNTWVAPRAGTSSCPKCHAGINDLVWVPTGYSIGEACQAAGKSVKTPATKSCCRYSCGKCTCSWTEPDETESYAKNVACPKCKSTGADLTRAVVKDADPDKKATIEEVPASQIKVGDRIQMPGGSFSLATVSNVSQDGAMVAITTDQGTTRVLGTQSIARGKSSKPPVKKDDNTVGTHIPNTPADEEKDDEPEEGSVRDTTDNGPPVMLGDVHDRIAKLAGDASLPEEVRARCAVVQAVLKDIEGALDSHHEQVADAAGQQDLSKIAELHQELLASTHGRLKRAKGDMDMIGEVPGMTEPAKAEMMELAAQVGMVADSVASLLPGEAQKDMPGSDGLVGMDLDLQDNPGDADGDGFGDGENPEGTKYEARLECHNCGGEFIHDSTTGAPGCPYCDSEDVSMKELEPVEVVDGNPEEKGAGDRWEVDESPPGSGEWFVFTDDGGNMGPYDSEREAIDGGNTVYGAQNRKDVTIPGTEEDETVGGTKPDLEKDAPPPGWECPACHQVNERYHARCTCGEPRPLSALSEEPEEEKDESTGAFGGYVPCTQCDGSGKVNGATCPACIGTGEVVERAEETDETKDDQSIVACPDCREMYSTEDSPEGCPYCGQPAKRMKDDEPEPEEVEVEGSAMEKAEGDEESTPAEEMEPEETKSTMLHCNNCGYEGDDNYRGEYDTLKRECPHCGSTNQRDVRGEEPDETKAEDPVSTEEGSEHEDEESVGKAAGTMIGNTCSACGVKLDEPSIEMGKCGHCGEELSDEMTKTAGQDRMECPSCGSEFTSEEFDREGAKCPTCGNPQCEFTDQGAGTGGDGKSTKDTIMDCPDCDGYGYFGNRECSRCHGTGQVEKPHPSYPDSPSRSAKAEDDEFPDAEAEPEHTEEKGTKGEYVGQGDDGKWYVYNGSDNQVVDGPYDSQGQARQAITDAYSGEFGTRSAEPAKACATCHRDYAEADKFCGGCGAKRTGVATKDTISDGDSTTDPGEDEPKGEKDLADGWTCPSCDHVNDPDVDGSHDACAECDAPRPKAISSKGTKGRYDDQYYVEEEAPGEWVILDEPGGSYVKPGSYPSESAAVAAANQLAGNPSNVHVLRAATPSTKGTAETPHDPADTTGDGFGQPNPETDLDPEMPNEGVPEQKDVDDMIDQLTGGKGVDEKTRKTLDAIFGRGSL